MTALRDPFAVVHKKDIKNKNGDVVAQVDYVGWSQVADRLDDAAPGWSFTIRQLGDDWCWGQLTIDGRTFENVGYAENADAAWKKEPLKDAVSDSLKRCASMAGVARYLYDKDAPHTAPRPVAAQSPARPVTAPQRSSTAVPDDLDWDSLDSAPPRPIRPAPAPLSEGENYCPAHNVPWVLKAAGVSKNGSPYDAFFTCGAAGPPWCTEKPTKQWVEAHHP